MILFSRQILLWLNIFVCLEMQHAWETAKPFKDMVVVFEDPCLLICHPSLAQCLCCFLYQLHGWLVMYLVFQASCVSQCLLIGWASAWNIQSGIPAGILRWYFASSMHGHIGGSFHHTIWLCLVSFLAPFCIVLGKKYICSLLSLEAFHFLTFNLMLEPGTQFFFTVC